MGPMQNAQMILEFYLPLHAQQQHLWEILPVIPKKYKKKPVNIVSKNSLNMIYNIII